MTSGGHAASCSADFSRKAGEVVQLLTEKPAWYDKTGEYDEKWLEESKAKLMKGIEGKKPVLTASKTKRLSNV